MYTPGPIHNNPLPNYREPKNFWLYVIIVVSFLIWLASMTSCYTPQKANRQALRAITTHPATVLPTFRSLYPCVTTGTTTTTDSAAYNRYRAQLAEIDSFYQSLLNNIEPEVIHDTTTVTDSARCNELKAAYRRNEAKWQEKVKVLYSRIAVLSEAVDSMPAIETLREKSVEDSAKLKEAALREQRLINELNAAKKREQSNADELSKTRRTRNWLWVAVIACAVYITRKVWLPVLNKMVNPLA